VKSLCHLGSDLFWKANMPLLNDAGFLRDVIGMPVQHARAFGNVAMTQRCVIIVRATGPTCLGLLVEGYDTKGYRVHAKSCDWGPMAGFVVRDPRLNKSGMGKAGFNREMHREAINRDHEGQGWTASTIPLRISQARIDWLLATHRIAVRPQAGGARLDGHATHPTGIAFYYSLIRENDGLFGVYFDNTRVTNRWRQEKGSAVAPFHPKWGTNYEAMLAVTNPPGHCGLPPNASAHLRAITGDYDLFAIWPYVQDYNPDAYGDDHRPLGTVRGSVGQAERDTVTYLERNFTVGGQGTKMGNITPRIYFICQMINSIVGRHVLWHSDETARPFLDDVDLPVIAFAPANGNQIGIRTVFDFEQFVNLCDRAGIRVTLSNAWVQAPTAGHPKRLGPAYDRFVPADGTRIIVPDWYNR
jgi:hypothetical protein